MRVRPIAVVLAALLLGGLPLAPAQTDNVVWSADIQQLLAQNNALAANTSAKPLPAPGIAVAFEIASMSLASRRLAVQLEGNETTDLLRAALDRQALNLESAEAIHAILEDAGTPRAKALRLLDEALTSRPRVLQTTSPRLLGYLEHQERAAHVVENLTNGSAIDVFAAAENLTRLQSTQLGIAITTPQPATHTSPCAALNDYADARSVPLANRDDCQALDALPLAVRQPLADVIDAFRAFEDATLAAYDGLDPTPLAPLLGNEWELNESEAWNSTNTSSDWNALGRAGVDLGAVLGARTTLLSATARLRDGLAAHPVSASAPCERHVFAMNDTIDLVAIDRYGCDNSGPGAEYTRYTILTIDLGGNDTYLNNAGGNRLIEPGGCNEFGPNAAEMRPAAAAALLDFGGDDFRKAPVCGANGGASLGAALLVDVGGNDTYMTRGRETVPNTKGNKADGAGVNGGGHIGVGMLLDDTGNDRYWGNGSYGINGGSLFGLGALIDGDGGDDDYDATFGGVNGGANGGAAALYDGGGRDRYNGEGRVANGGAIYGAGLLVDRSGNDTYFASNMTVFPGAEHSTRYSMGQNGGAKFGVGLLYDGGGHDWYAGLRDGANGGGVAGLGTLVDIDGDDHHDASYNGTIGAGWSLPPRGEGGDDGEVGPLEVVVEGLLTAGVGVGVLIDLGGNDTYNGSMFGTVGGAYIGASFFVDADGDDTYFARDGGGSIGGVGGHALGAGVALLYDAKGNDSYVTKVLPIIEETRDRPRSPLITNGTIEFGGKGANGGACNPGGVALLVDAEGDDYYEGNSTGINGGGAVGSVGMLVDGGGNDHYSAVDRGVNGGGYGSTKQGGINPQRKGVPGIGFLVDIAGNDSYYAGYLVTSTSEPYFDLITPGQGANGGAYMAFGFLFDGGGHDHYEVNGSAGNGGSKLGVGLLVDVARTMPSDDHYESLATVKDTTSTHAQNGGIRAIVCPQGGRTEVCLPGSVGLLLDIGGTDDYHDDDQADVPPNLVATGSGTDKCVFPKYHGETGAGQQRDWATQPPLAQQALGLPCA